MSKSGSRRGFIKKVAYTAPVVASLSVVPRNAAAGSAPTPSSTSKESVPTTLAQNSTKQSKQWKLLRDTKRFKVKASKPAKTTRKSKKG